MKKEFTEQPNYLSKIFLKDFCIQHDITLPVTIEIIEKKIKATDKKGKKIKLNEISESFIAGRLKTYKAEKAIIHPEYFIVYEIIF